LAASSCSDGPTGLATRSNVGSFGSTIAGRCREPAGVLPLSFEIEAKNLAEACAGFSDGAKVAFEETMKELQEMRRQQASSIVIPQGGLPPTGGMPGGGKIQMP